MADITLKKTNVEGTGGQDELPFKAIDMGGGYYAEAVAPIGPFTTTSSQLTGQIALPSTTTPVAGPNVALVNGVFVKPHPSNSSYVWVGNNMDAASTDFSATDGFPLSVGETMIFQVPNLNNLYFLPDASSDTMCWAKA